MVIRNYLAGQVFEPEHVEAMSKALVDACRALNIPSHDTMARETIATRIIALARDGVMDSKALCDRMVMEARSK